MEKNKVMMIVIILLLVLLLGTIIGVSLYVLGQMNQEPEVIELVVPSVPELQISEMVTFSAGTIRRNLLPQGTKHYVAVGDYSFEIDGVRDTDGALFALMTAKLDMVRDIINSVVGNTTVEEISAVNGQERLKEMILEQVSAEFNTNLIVRVNVAEFMYSNLN